MRHKSNIKSPLHIKLSNIFFLLIFSCSIFAATFSAQANDYDLISGTLDDGTQWAVVTPEPIESWNGTILLDLDGNSVRRAPLSAMVQYMIDHGYAYGGTTRTGTGAPNSDYNFERPVAKLVEVRQIFMDHYDVTPTWTLAMGSSRGGFVARFCMEMEPDIFDGALVSAGGGAGEIAVLNSRLDSLFVLKTLVDPASPLKNVGVGDNAGEIAVENQHLNNLVNLAISTPEGKARLALAAAVEQFAPWTVRGSNEPAADDYEAQFEQLIANLGFARNYVFANPAVVRAPIEAYAGGVVSWNDGVNYTQMLAGSGRSDFVKAMYKEAGLDLQADLKTLKHAPRIYADSAAVAKAEKVMSYTGEIYGPVINIDNIGDPVDSPGMKLAYQHTLRRAGNENLFRMAWVHSAGHGNLTAAERLAGLKILMDRLETGKWEKTSAKDMNEIAAEIASENPALGTGNFIEYHPAKLLRLWDVSDWDSYQ